MSLKPQVIPQTQLVDQVQQMDQQKRQLENSLDLLQNRLKMIESSLGENDRLRSQVTELADQSLGFFQEEWKRRTEFYPEIRLKELEKLLALIAPPAPKG